jgi:hypothetical protein
VEELRGQDWVKSAIRDIRYGRLLADECGIYSGELDGSPIETEIGELQLQRRKLRNRLRLVVFLRRVELK